jgi:hypothetical protein
MEFRVIYYQLIVGHLYKMGVDIILRRCVLEHERLVVLAEAHEGIAGGNCWFYYSLFSFLSPYHRLTPFVFNEIPTKPSKTIPPPPLGKPKGNTTQGVLPSLT